MRKTISILSAALTLFAACDSPKEKFEVCGQISGAEDKTLYFEASTLNGTEPLDSVRLDADGAFRFREARPANPEFYRLRIEGQIINLSIDSTETLQVKADLSDMGTGYTVEGSADCQTLKELAVKQAVLQQSIQEIAHNKNLTLGEQERMAHELVARYKEEMKRDYILKDPSAPYAYFALFQTLGGRLIFNPVNDAQDVKFVGAVATAWEALYPGTERTENLRNIALQGMKNTKRTVPATLDAIDPAKISTAGIIEVELPDIHGQNRKLSDLKGKAVLLDFTAYSLPQSQERIMQMRQLYQKYASSGFEIYQISIDPDEHYWKTACEHLPWICVYESEGETSAYLRAYLVRNIPTYFLIDRHNNLVARDEQVTDLNQAIQSLCE